MAAPFNQTVSCNSGIKPYENPDRSGDWTAAFDGTNLTLNSFNAGEPFGGALDGAERENYSGAALLRKDLGASNGTVYVTRTLDGTVISTGHHKLGNEASRDDVVECGENKEGPWITPPLNNPFRFENGNLDWVPGTASFNCAQRNIGEDYNAIVATNVNVFGPSGRLEVSNGVVSLIELQSPNEPGRSSSVPVDSRSQNPGGTRIWVSSNASSTITIDLRFDDLARRINQKTNTTETNCVPFPLDPRF
ncbi:MAG: hypothetical protein ACRBC3_21915 [Burkholderiaceae bacterium]